MSNANEKQSPHYTYKNECVPTKSHSRHKDYSKSPEREKERGRDIRIGRVCVLKTECVFVCVKKEREREREREKSRDLWRADNLKHKM